MGWLTAHNESEALVRQLIGERCRRQHLTPEQLTLHADRGAPLAGKSKAQLLDDLGIEKIHSRPHKSNDNPFSEAQFKTMKCCAPTWPACATALPAGLAPERFEALITELLLPMGFDKRTTPRTPYSNDGGIHVVGVHSHAGLTEVHAAVQVKCWQRNVQETAAKSIPRASAHLRDCKNATRSCNSTGVRMSA